MHYTPIDRILGEYDTKYVDGECIHTTIIPSEFKSHPEDNTYYTLMADDHYTRDLAMYDIVYPMTHSDFLRFMLLHDNIFSNDLQMDIQKIAEKSMI